MALKYVREGEDKYKVFKLKKKLKNKFEKEKESEKLSNKIKIPKMSYKSRNPLKKLLSHKKSTITVGGY